MFERWKRTKQIYGEDVVRRFALSHIAILGMGGVGSYAAEAILRSGIGRIDVYDFDVYEYSNFNRQLYANEETLGILKVEAFQRHAHLVNPSAVISAYSDKLTQKNIVDVDFSKYDYVIDAIDDIKVKINLIEQVLKSNTAIISAMGAGNKIKPELLEMEDIYKTSVCPLARIIRTEAKKRKLPGFNVVYSKEEPRKIQKENLHEIGSTAFVPAVMGLLIASQVINEIATRNINERNTI